MWPTRSARRHPTGPMWAPCCGRPRSHHRNGSLTTPHGDSRPRDGQVPEFGDPEARGGPLALLVWPEDPRDVDLNTLAAWLLPLSLATASNDASAANAAAAWAAALAAIAAAVVALVSLPFTVRAANAAKAQTALQREVAVAAAQPYVWADVQPDLKQGTLLRIVVGNEGPTVATNIRVTFSPPLATPANYPGAIEAAQKVLAEGVKSLAPGRRLEWSAGVGYEVLAGDAPIRHTVTVSAEGPHGPLAPLTYDLDLADWRRVSDSPDGSLHLVRKSIEELGSKLGNITSGRRLRVDAEVRESSGPSEE